MYQDYLPSWLIFVIHSYGRRQGRGRTVGLGIIKRQITSSGTQMTTIRYAHSSESLKIILQ